MSIPAPVRSGWGAKAVIGLSFLVALSVSLFLLSRPDPKFPVIAFLWVYERFRAAHTDGDGGTRLLLALPIVQLLWSNGHTLWIIGPALAWTAWAVEFGAATWPALPSEAISSRRATASAWPSALPRQRMASPSSSSFQRF